MPSFRRTRLLFTFVAAAAALAPLHLHADTAQFWNAIGAVGIADESSASLISFSDTGSVTIKSSVASGTAQLRYPVYIIGNMTKDLSPVGDRWCFVMQFRDNGDHSQVIAALKSVNTFTGQVVTHGTIDSKTFGDTGTAYETTSNCVLVDADGSPLMNFTSGNNAYYFDVKLIKTASDGNPGLKSLMFINSFLE